MRRLSKNVIDWLSLRAKEKDSERERKHGGEKNGSKKGGKNKEKDAKAHIYIFVLAETILKTYVMISVAFVQIYPSIVKYV